MSHKYIHQTISCAYDTEDAPFFSSGENLYLLNKGQTYHIYEGTEPITSFVVHSSGGIILGTEKGLSYLMPDYKLSEIVSTAIKDLTIIGDDLFIIFEDNSSVKITNISNYQRQIEEFSITN